MDQYICFESPVNMKMDLAVRKAILAHKMEFP